MSRSNQNLHKAGRGRDERAASADYLVVGEVLRPHGVRGELRMRVMTNYPQRLGELDKLYFGPEHTSHRLLGVRPHRGALLLRLDGIADREAAEHFREMLVYVHISEAVPLEDGEYYLFQLVGLEVVTDDGRVLGNLVDVIETGANDVYVVRGPDDAEILLPAIPQVIVNVDVPGGRMIVHLLEGLVE